MSDFEIAPSVLAADFGYLMRDIKAVEGKTNYLHLDVMDGHFVDNLSIGVPVVESIRRYTDTRQPQRSSTSAISSTSKVSVPKKRRTWPVRRNSARR